MKINATQIIFLITSIIHYTMHTRIAMHKILRIPCRNFLRTESVKFLKLVRDANKVLELFCCYLHQTGSELVQLSSWRRYKRRNRKLVRKLDDTSRGLPRHQSCNTRLFYFNCRPNGYRLPNFQAIWKSLQIVTQVSSTLKNIFFSIFFFILLNRVNFLILNFFWK